MVKVQQRPGVWHRGREEGKTGEEMGAPLEEHCKRLIFCLCEARRY